MTLGLLMDLVFEQSRAAHAVVARHPAAQVYPHEVERLASTTLQMYEIMKEYWNGWLQNALSQGVEAGSARADLTYALNAFEAWLSLAFSVQTVAQDVSSRTGEGIAELDQLQSAIFKVVAARDSARHAMALANLPPPEVDSRTLEDANSGCQQGKFRRLSSRENTGGV